MACTHELEKAHEGMSDGNKHSPLRMVGRIMGT